MAGTPESDTERQARAQIAETEEVEAEQGQAVRAARLFDLRMVIGGLLTLYGVVVTAVGLFASGGTRTKAAGINIDLWAGLAMLAAGLLFLAWVALRPLRAEQLEEEAAGDRR
ncbi:MAG TPA: hypothetical protein VFD04_03475 [Actinomycetes bacterium]|jgi:hypothetical protein|nr:hypothetical protein [Actinomycetes bacterium]